MSVGKFWKNIVILLILTSFFSALWFLSFELDWDSKQLYFRWIRIKPLDKVLVRYNGTYYANLIVVGLPGDTIIINNGEIRRNGRSLDQYFIRQYLVDVSAAVDTYAPDQYPVRFEYLTQEQFEQLKKITLTLPIVTPAFFWDSTIYPYSRQLSWNQDFFGKIIIPAKNMVIRLNHFTCLIYGPLIQRWEKHQISCKGNRYFVDGQPAQTYTFRRNYYFLLNPITQYTDDCRKWGPIPKSNILGKKVISFTNFKKQVSEKFSKLLVNLKKRIQ